MILDLDQGNSRVKWRLLNGSAQIATGAGLVSDILASLPIQRGGISRVRLSSVASLEVKNELIELCVSAFGVEPELACTQSAFGALSNGYEEPQSLGVDRWLALVAAFNAVAGSCVVVDCGTATTIDVIGDDGRHLGGYILPGLDMMSTVLLRGAANVVVDNLPPPVTALGKSSAACVVNGGLLATVGAIQQVVAHELGAELLLTGGGANVLAESLSCGRVVDNLVLDGLALVLP